MKCTVIVSVLILYSIKAYDEHFNNKISLQLEEPLKNAIHNGLDKYEKSGVNTGLFEWAINKLDIPENIFKQSLIFTTEHKGVCIGCSAIAKYFLTQIRSGLSGDKVAHIAIFVCTRFESERVCAGLVEINIDIFMYIVQERQDLNEKEFCSIVFQGFGCFKGYRPTWSVNIPDGYSPKKFFKVLHLTDIHADLFYTPRANAICHEPVCCQDDQGIALKPENGAGKWGDYRDCDMSYYSVSDMLKQTQNAHPTYIYFTGDIISHRVWDTSKENNTKQIRSIYKSFKDAFGSIPVFPVLGNHEPHPVNVFSPSSITNQTVSTQWLFDLMAEEWLQWLPNETYSTICYGGYYTVVVKPGFRIIALNSNVCYVYNWWLLFDNSDLFIQLQWLADVLAEAEVNNESVHILSHIPSGERNCLQAWNRQYHRIVERFANTITGQFSGHTHKDEWRIFYNTSNPLEAINVVYIGGSFTTYSNLNPNYRIYEIDSNTYEVLDYDEWIYNMDKANAHPDEPPNWYKLYSFRHAYGLKSMKPNDIGNLVIKMASNVSLLEQYYRFRVREATPAMKKGCDDNCLKENFCSIVTTEVGNDTQCKAMFQKLR